MGSVHQRKARSQTHRIFEEEAMRARYTVQRGPGTEPIPFRHPVRALTADYDMAATGVAVDREPYETSGHIWDRYDRGAPVREDLETFRPTQ